MISNYREEICIQNQYFLAEHLRPPGPVTITESVVPEIENITGIDNLFSLRQGNIIRNSEVHHQRVQLSLARATTVHGNPQTADIIAIRRTEGPLNIVITRYIMRFIA